MRRKSKILVVFSDNKTKNPLSKSSVGLFMLVKVGWKIGGLEPAQQAVCVNGVIGWFLKSHEEQTDSQADGSKPLNRSQAFTKQQMAEDNCD